MSFIADLSVKLIKEKKIHNLSLNREYSEFDFIGYRETKGTIDLLAFAKVDNFTEKQIVQLRDNFFEIVCHIPMEFSLKSRGRNPNGLLGFVFENECPPPLLIKFLQKQSRISHSMTEGGVVISWVFDIKKRMLYPHKNPVSLFPPVIILPQIVYPGFRYLQKFLSEYICDFQYDKSCTKVSSEIFSKTIEDAYLEAILGIFKDKSNTAILGTVFLTSFKNRIYGVTCAHVLREIDPIIKEGDSVSMKLTVSKQPLNANVFFIYPLSKEQRADEDIALLEFSEPLPYQPVVLGQHPYHNKKDCFCFGYPNTKKLRGGWFKNIICREQVNESLIMLSISGKEVFQRGVSGAPLSDSNGNIIGMIQSKTTGGEIAYLIPNKLIMEVFEQAYNKEEDGL